MEHDRSFQLTTVGGGTQAQREFEQLQRARIAPSAADDAFAEPPDEEPIPEPAPAEEANFDPFDAP